tara:strand:+ start:490 stop:921 length:432 start_codon:yes stop_codon:yes gene_type:complete
MKYYFLIFFAVLTILVQSLYAQQNFDLTVVVNGLENNDGVLQFGLYNDRDKFPIVGETIKMVRVKTFGSSHKYTFSDMAEGDYAVAIYQDENNNDNCDKNFFGIPVEPYAFSNDIRPKLSAPSFEDCSFQLNRSKTITIQLVY